MGSILLTLDEVAAELRVDRKTLLNWRCSGYGPRGFRMGRSVVFERDEVSRWVAERRDADQMKGRAGA